MQKRKLSVPMVVPGLSSNSGTSSSSTSPSQDSSSTSSSAHQSEVASSHQETARATHKKTQNKSTKRDNNRASDDRLRDLPDWLEEFTDNLTYRNGCKNSEKISWMTEFLNTETHTPVLPMNYLWSPRLREVWIWVNTVFSLTSQKTEIARSVKGPKLRGLHSEDAMAKLYSC